MKHALELLREAVNGPAPVPDPVEQLATLAKTFGGEVDVAKHQAADDQSVSSPVRRDSGAALHKTLDVLDLVVSPVERVLGKAVAKTRREEPPGLHHTRGSRHCGNCRFSTYGVGKSVDTTATAVQGSVGGSRAASTSGECSRYSWPVDRDELCDSWEHDR